MTEGVNFTLFINIFHCDSEFDSFVSLHRHRVVMCGCKIQHPIAFVSKPFFYDDLSDIFHLFMHFDFFFLNQCCIESDIVTRIPGCTPTDGTTSTMMHAYEL